MNAIIRISEVRSDDADLVQAARGGNRDAYAKIVGRYQALICSLAYSGTGSMARSEDIAQDTFVTAWKRLCDLRDPTTLRAWLCGIARNLINNAHRQSAHEPAEIGAPLDPGHEIASTESSPPEQAIREEEEAILWRALSRIPENYREPLILYYRKHRSVVEMADELGLTEDAAKQRLARGRALLQEQVLEFVEGTLERTKPNATFTSTVLLALPAAGTSLASAVGASTTKGSTATKAGTAAGGMGFSAAILSVVGLLGGFAGWQMAGAQSDAERLWSDRFWRLLVVAMAAFIAPAIPALMMSGRAPAWVLAGLSYYLAAIYAGLAAAFGIWAWENHQRVRERKPGSRPVASRLKLFGAALALAALAAITTAWCGFPNGTISDPWLELLFACCVMALAAGVRDTWQSRTRNRDIVLTRRRLSLWWVALATGCMALPFGWWLLKVSHQHRVPVEAATAIIAAHPDAQVEVLDFPPAYRGATRTLSVAVEINGRTEGYFSFLDDAALATLKQNGVKYETRLQGRDFEILGWPGRLLLLLSIFTAAAGTVVVARGLIGQKPSRVGSTGPQPTVQP